MVRTTVPQDELAAALTAELAPRGATRTTAALLLALANQETGSTSNMWNWNVGNITTADSSLDYWSPSAGKAKGLRFRAYETLDDGVRDFVRWIAARPRMWSAAGTGEVSRFAQSIRDTSYNPELDVAAASPQLFALAKQALPRFGTLPAGVPITLTGSNGTGWDGLILVALLWIATRRKGHG